MITALENLKKPITLTEISFPVFQLTNRQPLETDGVVYYITESFNKDNAVHTQNIRFIDDKTLPFETLSLRRLHIAKAKGSLYPIRRAIYFLGDFIKLAKKHLWFIDSKGQYFQYQKTTRAKLQFYKIENIFPIATGGAVVQVQGLPQRFKVLFKPDSTIKWAGIIEFKKLKILYGLYADNQPTSWRMI
jgi:hypothetical protein